MRAALCQAACATCFRSCSRRLRIDASRIEVAHAQHDPAEDARGRPRSRARSRGRSARRSARRSLLTVCSSSATALVTCDRQQLALASSHSCSKRGADAEDRRHPVALDQRLQEVHEDRVRRRSTGALEAVLLLLGREVRREEEDRQSAGCRCSASANSPSCSLDRVEQSLLLGDLEQRARVYLGDLFHASMATCSLGPSSRSASAREVELGERLLDQAPLVVARQRLAGHLLGRQHRQVGDLAADLLDRAAGLGLDVAPGLLEHLLALGARRRRRASRSCASAAWRARVTISSACPRASLSRSRYSASTFSASSRMLLAPRRSSPRSPSARRSSALRDQREHPLAQDRQRDHEHDQRPDHQPHVGGDQERAAGGDREYVRGECIGWSRGRRR